MPGVLNNKKNPIRDRKENININQIHIHQISTFIAPQYHSNYHIFELKRIYNKNCEITLFD